MKKLFIENRKNVAEKLKEHNNSVLVLFSGKEITKSGDQTFPFAVNKNFYYLTGLNKPDIYVVMKNLNGNITTTVYTPKPIKSDWVTPSYSSKQCQVISGIEKIVYSDFSDFEFDKDMKYLVDFKDEYMKNLISTKNVEFEDAYSLVTSCRAVKNKYEIAELKKAITITGEALKYLYKNLKNDKFEYQAQADFEYMCHYLGSKSQSFDTIAACGQNACTLHYSKNTDLLKKGDLLLLDLGATYNNYCADISRTVPINGKFSPLQKKIYKIVLDAQKLAIKTAKPGLKINDLNSMLIDYYFEKLQKLKLVKTREDVKKYYMHSIGHSLGLDTHDLGLSRDCPLVPGNVITIEPGLYIKEYGIGVRIEDNVLITENGCEVLSKNLPKTISQIEKLTK